MQQVTAKPQRRGTSQVTGLPGVGEWAVLSPYLQLLAAMTSRDWKFDDLRQHACWEGIT